MKKAILYGVVCAPVVFCLVSIPSYAELVDNGGGLIYDDVLDITWAQPDFFTRNWDDANAWAAGLTLGEATEWRLPYISVAEGAGPFAGLAVDCSQATEEECRDNELGYMFYQNLGGTFGESILDSDDPDLDLFPSLEAQVYWSGSETTEFPATAWSLNYADGGQSGVNPTTQTNFCWAVHDGNVMPVPTAKESWGTIKATYR